jgi:hypothetical protein
MSAALGFIQIFFFSSRFKARADYLRASHLTDVSVQLDATDEKIEEFSQKADRQKQRYDRQFRLCVAFLLGQAIVLFSAFSSLAVFMWMNFKHQVPS